jgi:hypothetical protein
MEQVKKQPHAFFNVTHVGKEYEMSSLLLSASPHQVIPSDSPGIVLVAVETCLRAIACYSGVQSSCHNIIGI